MTDGSPLVQPMPGTLMLPHAPPKLHPKALRFAQKLLADIIRDMPREGRDVMLETSLMGAEDTHRVLSYCAFYFDGTVERGTRIVEDKTYYMAVFTPRNQRKAQ